MSNSTLNIFYAVGQGLFSAAVLVAVVAFSVSYFRRKGRK
jgi:hypothetical protein